MADYWLASCDAGTAGGNLRCCTTDYAGSPVMCAMTPTSITGGAAVCIAFGNMRIDAAVSAEVLGAIAPLGLEAAIAAIADRERVRRRCASSEGASLWNRRGYEAARAHRQYNSVDPENRLVAGDLERRWNDRLAEAARLESGSSPSFATINRRRSPTPSARRYWHLGTELPRLVEPSGGIGGNA